MKIWKRIGAMAMVTAFSALALTGCGGGSSSGGDSASSDGWNIGYVNLADTDVFCMARESALTTELDGTGYSVSFSDGNNDNQKQIDQTNAFLAKGVDALILVPADSDAIAPAISAANSNGTPVICLGIKANSGDFTFVGSENYDSGHMQGEYMAENLPQGANAYLRRLDSDLRFGRQGRFRRSCMCKRPDGSGCCGIPEGRRSADQCR